MSSDKSVVGGEEIDHVESISEELDSPHAEMTSIHINLTSTAERRDEGVEIITAASLAGASAQSAVRINVYENIPFAGGDGDYSILSVLFGLHSIGGGIFSFLTMIDSNKVRVQCVECRQVLWTFRGWIRTRSLGAVSRNGVQLFQLHVRSMYRIATTSLMQTLCIFAVMHVFGYTQ